MEWYVFRIHHLQTKNKGITSYDTPDRCGVVVEFLAIPHFVHKDTKVQRYNDQRYKDTKIHRSKGTKISIPSSGKEDVESTFTCSREFSGDYHLQTTKQDTSQRE